MYKFFSFLLVLSNKVIDIPLFKKASSLILLSKIEALNFIDEKISFDGRKLILVPLFLVLPTFLKVLLDFH